MLQLVRRFAAAVLALALPPRCPSCGAIVDGDDRVCAKCWSGIRFITPPFCATCGEPFPHDLGQEALCGQCLTDSPVFARARAAVAYGDTSRHMLMRLKHGGRIHAARLMGRQMQRLEPDWIDDPEVLVVPVPLARWRLWSRGYNQALLIARALTVRSGAQIACGLLHRTRETRASGGLSRRARAKNVKGAFQLSPRGRDRVAQRRVLLIDDVYTTGATANACAAALIKAGAAEVRVLCWARVVLS